MFGIAKLEAFAQPQLRLVRVTLRFMKVTLLMLAYNVQQIKTSTITPVTSISTSAVAHYNITGYD
jgi:hypothetical protein